jgi:hypothetical protein
MKLRICLEREFSPTTTAGLNSLAHLPTLTEDEARSLYLKEFLAQASRFAWDYIRQWDGEGVQTFVTVVDDETEYALIDGEVQSQK